MLRSRTSPVLLGQASWGSCHRQGRQQRKGREWGNRQWANGEISDEGGEAARPFVVQRATGCCMREREWPPDPVRSRSLLDPCLLSLVAFGRKRQDRHVQVLFEPCRSERCCLSAHLQAKRFGCASAVGDNVIGQLESWARAVISPGDFGFQRTRARAGRACRHALWPLPHRQTTVRARLENGASFSSCSTVAAVTNARTKPPHKPLVIPFLRGELVNYYKPYLQH